MGARSQNGQAIVETLIVFMLLFITLAAVLPQMLDRLHHSINSVSLTKEIK
jgi:type II secretory pathway pseudopilin PulG